MAPLTNHPVQLKLVSFNPENYIKTDPTVSKYFMLKITNNEPTDVIVKMYFPKVTLVKCETRMMTVGSRETVEIMEIKMKAFDISIGPQFLKFKIRVVGIRDLDDCDRPTVEELWDSFAGRENREIFDDWTNSCIHTKLIYVVYKGMNKKNWWKKDGKNPVTWGIAKEHLPEAAGEGVAQ